MPALKKLLILTDWFAPGYKAGGPIQSCVNICAALNTAYDIYVLTTDTDHGETGPYPQITANRWVRDKDLNVQVCYLAKKGLSHKKVAEAITGVNADIVYLNHLFSPLFVVYPLWLVRKGAIKGRVVVCPRGALYESALSIKAYKKKPLLQVYKWLGIPGKVLFHATNEREQLAIMQHFPGSRTVIADNLPNIQQGAFVAVAKAPGFVKCIFIARIVPIKNLLFLLQALQQVRQHVALTVTGPAEEDGYWQQCLQKIESLPSNITVTYTGAVPHQDLKSLVQQHHLFILPTTGENFGHSIFEAMLAGRPVLISDQTPWLHLEKDKAGWDHPLGNAAGFTEVIETVAAFNQQQFDEYALGAWKYAGDYIRNKMDKEKYLTLFG